MRYLAPPLATASLLLWAATVCAQAPAGTPVPTAVTKAFQQAYPGATISEAKQERESDRPVYRVTGVDNGRRRAVLYDAGAKVIEVAEQVEEKELPKPVADALHAHPRAIFVGAMKVTRGGNVTYHLTARGSKKTSMIAKPDGTVVSWQ
jgi:hypothetical protein